MSWARGYSKHGTCPICKGDFDDCPHSWKDRDDHERDEHIRKIVREELKRANSKRNA